METADPNVIVGIALAALLIYGAHAGVVGIKHGVQHVFRKAPHAIVETVDHPKRDYRAIIQHETE